MNLQLNFKLYDIHNGKIIGLVYQDLSANFLRLIPFRVDVAKELHLPDADLAEFMDIDSVDVVTYKNKYAVVSTALWVSDDKTIPYEVVDDSVRIWGYVFHKFNLVEFIGSLEEASYGEDHLCE